MRADAVEQWNAWVALEYWLSSYELAGVSYFVTHAPSELQTQGVDAVVDVDGNVVIRSGVLWEEED